MNATLSSNRSYVDFHVNSTEGSSKEWLGNTTVAQQVANSVVDSYITISTKVSYFIVPFFAIFGLLGNTMTIIIMQSKYFRGSTINIYLVALSISDTAFILLTPFTKTFVVELFRRDPKSLTEAGCKAFFCLFRSAKICSSWFVVVICIERFIVVWLPLQAKRLSRRKTAIIAVLIVVVCVFAFDGVWTITSKVVGGYCLPNAVTENTKDLSAGFVVAGTLIFNIIPTMVLVLLTPLTILKLYRQMSFRRSMNANMGNGNDDTYRVTRMLLSVSIAYILLVTPISVAHSVAFFNGDNIFVSKDPDFIIFREIAQTLELLNYSINFFLYLMCNETFRRQFYILLGCRQHEMRSVMTAHRPRTYQEQEKRSESSTTDSTNINPSLE